MSVIHRLSDADLVAEVTRLAQREREATAALVAHLSELYGRRLHERAGYDSPREVPAVSTSDLTAYDASLADPIKAPLCAAVPPRELVRPLSPERYQFTFTGGTAAREKLEMATDLLRHVCRTATPPRCSSARWTR